MKKGYLFIIIITMIIGIVAAILPFKDNSNQEISAEKLLLEMNLDSRYYTTDQIAGLIINEDPSLLLIDVRPAKEFDVYHLTNAINIPLKSILNEEFLEVFSQDYTKKVLYGNGTIAADKAWMILRRIGYSNVFVMTGGLTSWVETILKPTLPDASKADIVELEKYQVRLAASQYFGMGGKKEVSKDVTIKKKPESSPKPVKTVERKAAGGC